MSSLRLAHSSRDRDRSSTGTGGITNEAFAQSSVSLYKRISSTENLHIQESSSSQQQPQQQQPNTSLHSRMSTSVLTVPQVMPTATSSSSSAPTTGSASPKGGGGGRSAVAAGTSGETQNSSPGSSGSSTTVYYQHQVHNHQGATNELIAIKSKFEAEFRRFSLQRSDITNLDDFLKTIEHFHKLFSIPFNIFYADPVHGDLLPINNDVNFGLAISSAKPLLRLFVQRKDGTLAYFPMAKKNFLGTLLPSSSSSGSSKPRLAISAPEDFRQVSSIIDVDIVPDTCRRVRLVKHGSDKPLGFYIRDGTSVRVTAHGVEKVPGIFISRLIPGGLAESTGLLAVNDEVLEVNGIEVNGKSLDQVTDMMVANSSNLIITIRPANQRGHSTLSGSFSSNTISTTASGRDHRDHLGGGYHHHHQGPQTNSLERGAVRAKKMQAPPPPPLADFHNAHHPVHYGGSSVVSGSGGGIASASTNPFESLQRTAAHRHSASIIPGHGAHGHGQHHHHYHHEPLSYHQFTANRHSVIGGPGMQERGVTMVTGGSLGGALQGPSVLHHDDDESSEDDDDDDEDEVRDHFTTSLVINSGAPEDRTTGQTKPNGHHNTTVIINQNPQTTNLTISTTSLPVVNRSNFSSSTAASSGSGSQAAAASSAATFIRNSLRGKNGGGGGSGHPTTTTTAVSSKSFSTPSQQDTRSLYAHLYHHSDAQINNSAHPSRSSASSSSAGSSPTITSRSGAVSTNPGTSTDDIVTL